MDPHEEAEVNTLRKLFATGNVDCVFDVGANAGQYAKRIRQDVKFDGPIISYEPIPRLFEEISRKALGDKNWYCEPYALDAKKSTRSFQIMKSDQFSSLSTPKHTNTNIFQNMNIVAEIIEVECQTFASEFNKYKEKLSFQRPFLKMDTQGNDVDVIRGGLDVLTQLVGFQSELAVTSIYEGSCDFRAALYFYESLGFRISSMVPPNKGHFPYLIEVDAIMINKDLFDSLTKQSNR